VVRFIDEVLAATNAAPVTVVLTLRGDFYDDVLGHRGLADALPKALVNLGPLTHEELEWAVTQPAEKVGLRFDPGLVDRLLDDVGDEPGNLPLMEFALKELWGARRGDRLLYDVYKAMDGIKGAIAKRAETLYEKLDPAQKQAAERLFTKLVRPGEKTGDTRRRADLSELDPTERDLVRTLASAQIRLLVTGRDELAERETVEVAHEALIGQWEQLRGWVRSYRTDLEARDRLEQMAQAWAQGTGELVRGRQLRAFRSLRGGRATPSEEAEKYLRASGRRAVRRIAAGAVAVLALSAGLATFGYWINKEEMRPAMAFYVLAGEAGWIVKKPKMIEIRPGEGKFPTTFLMGSGDDDPDALGVEKPRHRVTLKRPFAIGRYEVTFDEYELFARVTGRHVPSDAGWGTRDRPVIHVSWKDAQAYADWLFKETGKEPGRSYRLPTEAEWEYAARAGTGGRYWWCGENQPNCDIPPDKANCRGCKSTKGLEEIGQRTLPVGSFPANGFGLHDTAGNIWEWVQDCWHENYERAPKDGSAWGKEEGGDCGRRPLRGGSWLVDPDSCRSADRTRVYAGNPNRDSLLGFRLAQDL
jgi:formylglycine-generating enzyme required for sulfatase activity